VNTYLGILVGQGNIKKAKNLTKVVEITTFVILGSISVFALIFKNILT
jgi:hypothetical protein